MLANVVKVTSLFIASIGSLQLKSFIRKSRFPASRNIATTATVSSSAKPSSSSSLATITTAPTATIGTQFTMEEQISNTPNLKWIDLNISPQEMRPENTLMMGQCFNWKKIQLNDDTANKLWTGVVFDLPIIIRQLPTTTHIACLLKIEADREQLLIERMRDYFQLQHSLPPLYQLWSSQCNRMQVITSCLPGVRVLRQDPWECLISFICSSNNNIPRISLMLDRLRTQYGRYLCSLTITSSNGHLNFDVTSLPVDTQSFAGPISSPSAASKRASTSQAKRRRTTAEDAVASPSVNGSRESDEDLNPIPSSFSFYTFPTVDRLLEISEDDLRALGMGYRAKFIRETASLISSKEGGAEKWFQGLRDSGKVNFEEDCNNDLRHQRRLEVQNALLELPGVGRKVADCVAVFSLDQSNAIPVDVHVWSIAVRDYCSELANNKSLTPTVYEKVGDVFRNIFLKHAGWAHSILFAAELSGFRTSLPEALQEEMKVFAENQKVIKRQKKEEKNVSKTSQQQSAVVTAKGKKSKKE